MTNRSLAVLFGAFALLAAPLARAESPAGKAGNEMEKKGNAAEKSADAEKAKGKKMQKKGEAIEEAGEKADNKAQEDAGKKMQKKGKAIEKSGEARHEAAEEMEKSGAKVEEGRGQGGEGLRQGQGRRHEVAPVTPPGAGSLPASGARPSGWIRAWRCRARTASPRALRAAVVEAALLQPDGRIAERAEHDVPQRQVAVVVRVHAALVVNAVRLGTLDDVAQPARGADVGVLEHGRNQAVDPRHRSRAGRQAEQRKHQQRHHA